MKLLKIALALVSYIAIAVAEMVGVHYLSGFSPLLGALLLGVSVFVWGVITPINTSGSDPAGAGMTRGFVMIFNIIGTSLMTIIFYIFMKFCNPESVLKIFITLASIYILFKILAIVRSAFYDRY